MSTLPDGFQSKNALSTYTTVGPPQPLHYSDLSPGNVTHEQQLQDRFHFANALGAPLSYNGGLRRKFVTRRFCIRKALAEPRNRGDHLEATRRRRQRARGRHAPFVLRPSTSLRHAAAGK